MFIEVGCIDDDRIEIRVVSDPLTALGAVNIVENICMIGVTVDDENTFDLFHNTSPDVIRENAGKRLCHCLQYIIVSMIFKHPEILFCTFLPGREKEERKR